MARQAEPHTFYFWLARFHLHCTGQRTILGHAVRLRLKGALDDLLLPWSIDLSLHQHEARLVWRLAL